METMKTKLILILAITILLLSGFSGQHLTMYGNNAWIDAPLHGSVLPLAPYNVISHAASPNGIASFELSVNGQVYRLDDLPADQNGMTLAFIYQEWIPPAPGTYVLSVRAVDMNGEFGNADQVEIQIEGMLEGKDDVPKPTPTYTPTPEACTFTAKLNLFCREGPDLLEIDSFVPGDSATVIGESTDGFYWFVLGPHYGEECTVPSEDRFGEVTGDCDSLEQRTPKSGPLATDTPQPDQEEPAQEAAPAPPTETPSRARPTNTPRSP
jgi:hypothetical protein